MGAIKTRQESWSESFISSTATKGKTTIKRTGLFITLELFVINKTGQLENVKESIETLTFNDTKQLNYFSAVQN